MKVFIKNRGEKILSDNDCIGTGGQASVYAKDGIAYKIYTNPSNMIPVQKIEELSILQNPLIISPKDIILDTKNKPIGYTMRHVKNAQQIVSLFTKGFRNANQIDNNDILHLVKNMQDTYKYIHNKDILVIDGNEVNLLVDNKFTEVYFLDVDSFQTKNYPATYLMESIRDRHCNGKFDKNTDWFAFGIISFQLFIGIHPYRGIHKKYHNMNERMVANISVLNKDVGLPPVCQPFNVIPKGLLEWYKAVFEDGKRIPPPDKYESVGIVISVNDQVIKGNNQFDIALKEQYSSEIWQFISILGTKKAIITNQLKKELKNQIYGVTPKSGKIILGGIDSNQMINLRFENGDKIDINLSADGLLEYNGRIYFKSLDKIFQIDFVEIGNRVVAGTKIVANVHENATKLFEGIAIQNLMGTANITIFPEDGISYTLSIPEVKGKIVDAKFDSGVAMVVCVDKQGKYNRHVIRISKDYSEYDISTVSDITYTGLNFITLDKGICCHLNEKVEMELFSAKKGDSLMKTISDPTLHANMKLFKDGNSVLFATNRDLYSIKTK